MAAIPRYRPHAGPILLSAGFRPFFLGSAVWAAIGIPLWLAVYGSGTSLPSLLPPLTVVENVALPLLLAGRTEAEATSGARAALERLDLADLASKLPEEISGGQAQRVAVARALTGHPVLLLADEPTGQLDHENASAVVDVLEEAAQHSGAALIVATHDPEVAGRLSRQWRMDDGALLAPEEEPCAQPS